MGCNPYLKSKNLINAKMPPKYAPPAEITAYNAIAMSAFVNVMESLITKKVSDINTVENGVKIPNRVHRPQNHFTIVHAATPPDGDSKSHGAF